MTNPIPAYEHTCLRCGFVWRSLNERPGVCGRCKSRVWDKAKKEKKEKAK